MLGTEIRQINAHKFTSVATTMETSMKRIGFRAAAIAFAALCTAPAMTLAATITLFSESVSGDLGQGAAAPSLSAVLGQNLVDGTTSWIGPSPDVAAVPEPGTYASLLGGLGLLILIVRRRTSVLIS